jgi:hypothetical protein
MSLKTAFSQMIGVRAAARGLREKIEILEEDFFHVRDIRIVRIRESKS